MEARLLNIVLTYVSVPLNFKRFILSALYVPVFILMLVSSGFGALVFTLYLWIVPASITLHQAAAPPETQRFLLISFALLAPVTLLYNTWGFRLFSGKIR